MIINIHGIAKTLLNKPASISFLISEELMTMVERVDIISGYRTDHAIIKLELRVTEMERGKGVCAV